PAAVAAPPVAVADVADVEVADVEVADVDNPDVHIIGSRRNARWWGEYVQQRSEPNSQIVEVTLEDLLVRTLAHSSQVKVFSDLPLIRQTAIAEAEATFDWSVFAETKWRELSEPVGNTLTTGGPSRFRDDQWTYDWGMRRRTTLGTTLEAKQSFGYQNNNSIYFQPKSQGNTRITLGFTQPLMRGGGRVYNTSLIVLADIDAEVAEDEFHRQLQSHLLEVTRSYWALYLERGSLAQRYRLQQRGLVVLQDLESRKSLDARGSQIARARSAFLARESDLARAVAAVKNAQDRVIALVNDPHLANTPNLELLPMDTPMRHRVPAHADLALTDALQYRPEVNQALKQIKAASVRMDMSKHELLPVLNFIAETYVTGLRGNNDIGTAFSDQFNNGEPSYSVGLQYELPLYNRAAKARMKRRQLEMRQLQNQFQSTVATLTMEVKVAAREVETSFTELTTKYSSMEAAQLQLESLTKRWKLLPGESQSASLYLEDVLAAQERLTNSEYELLKSEMSYNLSLMNLKRARGTLLQEESIDISTEYAGCLPQRRLSKGGTAGLESVPDYSGPVHDDRSNEIPRQYVPGELVPLPGDLLKDAAEDDTSPVSPNGEASAETIPEPPRIPSSRIGNGLFDGE
ncbi:MAG: outer membrane protein, partial [Pirellulaceae bacterium]